MAAARRRALSSTIRRDNAIRVGITKSLPLHEGRLRFPPSRCKALNSRTCCTPPLDAIVLVVDEKSHIQALERAQGYRKLPNGRALSGRSHDYKRNGTSTGREAAAAGSGLFAIPPQYGINTHCNP